jgi:hypothetical protein
MTHLWFVEKKASRSKIKSFRLDPGIETTSNRAKELTNAQICLKASKNLH